MSEMDSEEQDKCKKLSLLYLHMLSFTRNWSDERKMKSKPQTNANHLLSTTDESDNDNNHDSSRQKPRNMTFSKKVFDLNDFLK